MKPNLSAAPSSTSLQGFYNLCVKALFNATPFPKALDRNQKDMLGDFRTTLGQFHRAKWHEEARDIGLEYGLETETLATL